MEELMQDFQNELEELNTAYRKGVITEYEYCQKLTELYDQYAHQIGLRYIYEHRQ